MTELVDNLRTLEDEGVVEFGQKEFQSVLYWELLTDLLKFTACIITSLL